MPLNLSQTFYLQYIYFTH